MGQEETSAYTALKVFGDAAAADVPPEIIVSPQDRVVKKGQATDLQCIANAKPLFQLELIWLKDGSPIEQVGGLVFAFNDIWNRTLSLYESDYHYAGTYECQVRMKTGGPRLTRSAQVTVVGR